MVRVRIKSDAPLFSAEDYSYIMQCRDIKPRYKILKELLDKYKTSSKHIYQIWRGEHPPITPILVNNVFAGNSAVPSSTAAPPGRSEGDRNFAA